MSRLLLECVECRTLLSFLPVNNDFAGGVVPLSARFDGTGAIVALPTGRVLVQDGTVFRAFTAQGMPDRSYGKRGQASVQFVDDATGFGWTPRVDSNGSLVAADVYTPNGKFFYSVTDMTLLPTIGGGTVVAFDDAGRMLVATNPSSGQSSIDVYRLRNDGTRDPTFGTAGVAQVLFRSNQFVFAGFSLLDIGALPGSSGVWVRYESTTGTGSTDNFIRLSAHGRRVLDYGADSVLSLLKTSQRDNSEVETRVVRTVLSASAQGALVFLEQETTRRPSSESFEQRLVRHDGNGRRLTSTVIYKDGYAYNGTAVAAGDGFIVCSAAGVFTRYNADLSPDSTWNGFNGAQQLLRMRVVDWTATPSGEVYAVGQTRNSLTADAGQSFAAFSWPVEGFGASANTARLLPGGVLEIAGTGAADRLRLDFVDGEFVVRLNGVVSKFSADRVRGIVVHTGRGNDRIDLSPNRYDENAGDEAAGAPVYVQSGAGNDRITTGDWKDTVEAGAGNDQVSTGRGSDVVWGGSGNDVIIGGQDGIESLGDTLYGGPGDDALYASTEVPAARDPNVNYLYAGPGRDRLYASALLNDASNTRTRRDVLSGQPGDESVYP